MRTVLPYLLLLALLAGLGAPWTMQAPQAAQPQNSQSALDRLKSDFDALIANPARGGRRDLWLALEERFASLAARSTGDVKAGAAFFHARSREELGRRSFLASDHREAVARFAAVAAAHPGHAVAAESLYRQADILTRRLNDRQSAIAVLEKLIKAYPKAGIIPEARTLLARAKEAPPAQQARKQPPGGGAAQKPARKPSAEAVMEQLGLTVKTIMIDAGHGGNDPGARSGGITEKTFTLAMARRVGALLEKEGFTVLYTRTTDRYIALRDRTDMANSKSADLFISIHVNANANPSVRGLETYYLGEARTRNAQLVAARENGVSVRNVSDLQFILTDLMLSSKVKESRQLAEHVHSGILRRLRGARLAAPDNGVRSAPFYVLMGARMPAILVEFGYITNEQDAANLKNDAFLQRQAEGLVQGIKQYRADLAKSVPQMN